MSDPGDVNDMEETSARRIGAAETPRARAKGKPTREERLAKALRDNLRRRKAVNKKDQA
jgi:hypothetical protein